MTATAFIIGATGCNGSQTVDTLAAGARVRVLDDVSMGWREDVAGMSGALEVIEGDVRECEAVAASMRGYDSMLHRAAIAPVTTPPSATAAVQPSP